MYSKVGIILTIWPEVYTYDRVIWRRHRNWFPTCGKFSSLCTQCNYDVTEAVSVIGDLHLKKTRYVRIWNEHLSHLSNMNYNEFILGTTQKTYWGLLNDCWGGRFGNTHRSVSLFCQNSAKILCIQDTK